MSVPGSLPANPSKISSLTADQWVKRILELYPAPWSGDTAKVVGGLLYSFFKSGATNLVDIVTILRQVEANTRIKTAVNDALDTISLDFFGGLLPRLINETDDSFRARIYGNLFIGAITKINIKEAVEAYTGQSANALEPWSPQDCAIFDVTYIDVDGDGDNNHGRWCDPNLKYQGFIEAVVGESGTAISSIWTMDKALSYDEGPAALDLALGINVGNTMITGLDALINRTKAFGTLVWRQYAGTPPKLQTSGEVVLGTANWNSADYSVQVTVRMKGPYAVILQYRDPLNYSYYGPYPRTWVTDKTATGFTLHGVIKGHVQWLARSHAAGNSYSVPVKPGDSLTVPINSFVQACWKDMLYTPQPGHGNQVYFSEGIPATGGLVDIITFSQDKVTLLLPILFADNNVDYYHGIILGAGTKHIFVMPYYWLGGNLYVSHGPGSDEFSVHQTAIRTYPIGNIGVIVDE